jgi:O-antigen ligase
MIWQSAEKVLENSWVWGIGAGNFQEKYLEYQKYFAPYLEWAVPHPHNLYLALWLYGGIFGLVGFLALVFFWFSALFRSQKNPSLRFIGLGIMLYVLLHGLVDTTYLKNDLAVLFWLLFALI